MTASSSAVGARDGAALAIRIRGLVKSFGDVRALRGVDLDVTRGSVLALLGPNGAGKSTLVRVVSTLIRPDDGDVRIAGHDVAAAPARVRERIGLAGQHAAVDERLTARENLELVGRLTHLARGDVQRRATELLERFHLTDAADRPVKTYSGGMRRRLDLAASLVNEPEILLLDEPTTGLDPKSRLDLWDVIGDLSRAGTTLLLTTQYLEEADQLADRIVVIDHGRVIAEGTPSELKARVGGDVLHVTLKDAGDVAAAADALADLAVAPVKRDEASAEVALPVPDPESRIPEVVRRLDKAGIAVTGLTVRRPTLDDVFLALTGRVAPDEGGDRA